VTTIGRNSSIASNQELFSAPDTGRGPTRKGFFWANHLSYVPSDDSENPDVRCHHSPKVIVKVLTICDFFSN
jgi:hypothetical protein